jgi:hypothetical protein
VEIALDWLLDMALILCIITANKDVDEDEYALDRRPREQDQVRTCPHDSAEWTSELQSER